MGLSTACLTPSRASNTDKTDDTSDLDKVLEILEGADADAASRQWTLVDRMAAFNKALAEVPEGYHYWIERHCTPGPTYGPSL